MKKIIFLIIFFGLFGSALWALPDFRCNCALAAEAKNAREDGSQENQWVEMPAGAKPSYMGIHGGTMPVSLLVSDDGSSLLSFVGRTGNDFLEVLRKAYLPFPSFANATRAKFSSMVNVSERGKIYAGNATASMPVLSLSTSPVTSPDWISHFQPFGLSEEPLSIEGNVSRPEIIPLPKKYRVFFLPERFFPAK